MFPFKAKTVIPAPPFSEQADVAHPAGQGVHQHDDHKVDHVQAQPDGGSVRILRLVRGDAHVVHIDAQDIRGGHVSAGLQQQRLVRIGGKQRSAVQDQHHHRDRNQVRNVDVPDFVPSGRPVNGGRLIQLRIDTGQRRDIQDRIPSSVLPDFRSDEQRTEPAGFHDEVDAFPARGSDHMVDNAVRRGEEEVDHACQDHCGNKVGHIDGRLGEALETLQVQLVQ